MFQYVSAIFNNLYFGVEGVAIPIAIIVALFLYFIHKELTDLINKDLRKIFIIFNITRFINFKSIFF